jgi:hypothetical protein
MPGLGSSWPDTPASTPRPPTTTTPSLATSATARRIRTSAAAGLVTTDIAGAADFGHAVALRSDGRIVVAGRVSDSGGNGEQFGVVQYDEAGQPDETFGDGGVAIPPFVNGGIADGIAVQPDGSIVGRRQQRR